MLLAAESVNVPDVTLQVNVSVPGELLPLRVASLDDVISSVAS